VHKFFALLSSTLVVLIAVTLWLEMKPQGSPFQEAYQKILHEKTGSGVNEPKIRQDWLPALHRTDRCRTCHLGIEDSLFKNEPQPLRTHSAIPNHDFRKFGCTVCHEGQGLATNTAEAHGRAGSWEYPMLPGNVVEGACGRCHLENSIKGAPLLSSGRQLINEYGCIGCHKLPAFNRPDYIGPDLGGIAGKVKPQWIVSWLQNPREYLPKTIMPNSKLTEDQATDIASYLMAQSPVTSKHNLSSAPPDEKIAAQGKLIFSQSRCVTCHALEGKGGALGPDLGRAGDKLEGDWLNAWLDNPKNYFPKTRMPRFNFSSGEIKSLSQHILTDLSNGDYRNDVSQSFGTPGAVDRGKKLILKFGCTGCHVVPGIADSGRELAPSLETIGSKTTSQFVFGGTTIKKTAPNWIFIKLQRPRVFGEELVMPLVPMKHRQLPQPLWGRRNVIFPLLL
jgi:mono/diheme cytochrome c family protein